MLKEKMIDLINANFSRFRLAPIVRFKGTRVSKEIEPMFEKLPLSEGINIEKKAKNYNSYFVIGTIRPDGDEMTYEDCGFRTFDNIDVEEFNEFKELVGYAQDLIKIFRENSD